MVDRESADASRRAPPPGTEAFDKFIFEQTVAAVDAATSMVLVRVVAAAVFLLYLAEPLLYGPIEYSHDIFSWIGWLFIQVELGSVVFRGKAIFYRTMRDYRKNGKRAKPKERPED